MKITNYSFHMYIFFFQKKVTSCYLYWRLIVVVLLIVLFVLGGCILKPYIVHIAILGTAVCLYKLYCFWVVKEFVGKIGTVSATENMDSLPTVCGENEEFTKL